MAEDMDTEMPAEVQAVFKKIVESESGISKVDLKETGSKDIKDLIKSPGDYVLLTTLSPVLTNNENQKRTHRKWLLLLIGCLLIVQLVFLNIVIVIIVSSVVFDFSFLKSIDQQLVNSLLEFLKYFISAVIVEILGMFFFIVRNVFDKTINNLVDAFSKKGELD